jgi:hypothetical protein
VMQVAALRCMCLVLQKILGCASSTRVQPVVWNRERIVTQEFHDRRERRRTRLLPILLPVVEAGSPHAQLFGGFFLRKLKREPSPPEMIA